MNQPPSPQPQHVCFSGSPACSGCNPCPDCQAYVQEQVMPSAFLASRMNETLLALHSIIGALLERNVDPRALGVDLTRVFPTLEEQADAFFQGYVEGWGRMHEGMRTNPAVRQRLVATPVAEPASYPAPAPVHPTQGAAGVPSTEPPTTGPQPAAVDWKAAFEEQQKRWDEEDRNEQHVGSTLLDAPHGVREEDVLVRPNPKPAPVPLSAEEVSAAGFPIAPTSGTVEGTS